MLRMAVAEAMCSTPEKRKVYPEAIMAVKAEGDINRTKPSHGVDCLRWTWSTVDKEALCGRSLTIIDRRDVAEDFFRQRLRGELNSPVAEWRNSGLMHRSRLGHFFGVGKYSGGESNSPGVERLDKGLMYCKRINSPSFWGGEAELLVLSKMLKTPIRVYLRNSKVRNHNKVCFTGINRKIVSTYEPKITMLTHFPA
eukprot:1194666-Prorocentrum_minimum.AAC.12